MPLFCGFVRSSLSAHTVCVCHTHSVTRTRAHRQMHTGAHARTRSLGTRTRVHGRARTRTDAHGRAHAHARARARARALLKEVRELHRAHMTISKTQRGIKHPKEYQNGWFCRSGRLIFSMENRPKRVNWPKVENGQGPKWVEKWPRNCEQMAQKLRFGVISLFFRHFGAIFPQVGPWAISFFCPFSFPFSGFGPLSVL